MIRFITTASIVLLVSWQALAAGPMTVEQIQQVIDAADAAAVRRDADRARQLLRDQINHDGALLMRRFQTYTPKRTPSRSSAPDRPTNPEEPK